MFGLQSVEAKYVSGCRNLKIDPKSCKLFRNHELKDDEFVKSKEYTERIQKRKHYFSE